MTDRNEKGRAMPTLFGLTSTVREMRRTLDFYRLLGLEIPATDDRRGYVHLEGDNGPTLAWISEDADPATEPTWRRQAGPGRLVIGFRCASPDTVDATFCVLVKAGHPPVLEPMDVPWGARLCRVRDPDGNTVEVFAPQP